MKYRVNVARTGYANLDIEVEADSPEEAREKALDTAGDHVFSEHYSEYKAQFVTDLIVHS